MKLLSSVNIETSESVDINLSPLIDMVFLLLIFFMVTAVFVEETGIEIEKPSAVSAEQLEKQSILLAVNSAGQIYFDNREISPQNLRGLVARLLRSDERPVIVMADTKSRTGALVQIIDQCRMAGAASVSVATQEE